MHIQFGPFIELANKWRVADVNAFHEHAFEQAAKEALTGESWSLASHPLMTPEEIGRFFARDDPKFRQLIIRPGYRPMILQRAFVDKHELFQGRISDEG